VDSKSRDKTDNYKSPSIFEKVPEQNWLRHIMTSVAAFHFDTDPDPTFHSDADPKTYPTTHFFPDFNLTMLQNDPLSLPPFHFDADSDHAFHFDADPDPDFHFDADPDTASPK
jgi:hypothetical protein